MARTLSRHDITDIDDPEEQAAHHFGLYPNGKPCFYCGATLRDARDDPSVYWSGHPNVIYFHLRCARVFAEKLAEDAGEVAS